MFSWFLILTLAFQPNDIGNIVRASLVDAYLQVSVFVGFTLFVFLGIDYLTNLILIHF